MIKTAATVLVLAAGLLLTGCSGSPASNNTEATAGSGKEADYMAGSLKTATITLPSGREAECVSYYGGSLECFLVPDPAAGLTDDDDFKLEDSQ